MAIDPTPPQAVRLEWIGRAVIALPCLQYSMDLTNLLAKLLPTDLAAVRKLRVSLPDGPKRQSSATAKD